MTVIPYSMSAPVRVLTALNGWFRQHGCSPSYREISLMAHVPPGRVRRYLEQLRDQGRLTYQRGVPRSIVMTDLFANASDAELELACRGRSWTIVKPPSSAIAIGQVYPVADGITSIEVSLLAAIDATIG